MVEHMKWYGWGREDVAFSHEDKPSFAPFVADVVGVDLDAPSAQIPDLAGLDVPAPRHPAALADALVGAVGADQVHTDDLDRVVHTYGKSLRDLVRARAGIFGRVPDLVVYPADEDQIAAVLAAALAADAVVIPFGGGSNIVGSLEAPVDEPRPVVSVDLGRLDRVVEVDAEARLARIQAGVLGPEMERQLNELGWTMGHFPDSFSHSTLGGWIATRSSGMQSDVYGDIGQITKAVRVLSPGGVIATRAVPSQSTGPSVLQMVLGSEGRLGIITEATVQVHRLPAKRVVLGYFFPSFDAGVTAMREIAESEAAPIITRVSDARETRFSFATRRASHGLSGLVSAGLKRYLSARGWDLDQMCLSFIGYEGSPLHVANQKAAVAAVVKRNGGIGVGTGPGTLYDQKKFDTPYIRDFLLDRGALADVSETATSWSRLLPLYRAVVADAEKAFAAVGVQGWIMCHLSHSYHSGACLYFTFAFAPAPGTEPVPQYDTVKSAVQQAFLDNGGTLSHHHAVGREHARWLAEDISPAGSEVLAALFAGVDPGRNLNPGAILPAG
jgi:alkyldihydroxyacetonephosphate synthase